MILRDTSARRAGRGRGMSSTIGFVLLLGIVAITTTGIVALGTVALEDTERQSTIERAEQSMAQFDSRAAQVALGSETTQRLSFGRSSGRYHVDGTVGRIRIEHLNYSKTGADATIYNGTLGAVTYRNGETTIAYQGGGVWRADGDGRSRMISPPEFHYRGSTLTLPIVSVDGENGASGSPTAVVQQTRTARVFPNASASYANGRPYINPASNGQIRVTVTSEYYEGWADYFTKRTETNVSDIDHVNRTVTAELITLGDQGRFDIPTDGNPLSVRGLAANNLSELSLTVRAKDDQPSKLASIDWSLYAEEDGQRLEMNIDGLSNGECNGSDNEADISIYYSDDYGETYHGWNATDAVEVTCDADGDPMLVMEFTDASVDLTYGDLSGNLAKFNPSGGARSSVSFDRFDGDTGWTYTHGSTESLAVVVNHYFGRIGPTFELKSSSANGGNNVDVGRSEGNNIVYQGNDVITFLHISENQINVEFE